MNTLPNIVFDGVEIIAKNGRYYCPFNCSDVRYPTKSWKTEKGFRTHLEGCQKSPSAIKKHMEIKRLRDAKKLADAELGLATAEYKVGDVIWYVREYIRHPMYEQRGLRSVKVRYEEVRGYSPEVTTINSVAWKNGTVVYNNHIVQSMVCHNKNTAELRAKTWERAQEEHIQFASLCR
jgi:hypothetical protein